MPSERESEALLLSALAAKEAEVRDECARIARRIGDDITPDEGLSPLDVGMAIEAAIRDPAKGDGDGPAGETETEIEISSEMIEAGERAYRERDSRFMRDKDIVEVIFLSMIAAAPRPKLLEKLWESESESSSNA